MIDEEFYPLQIKLTKREWFAGLAMQGRLTNAEWLDGNCLEVWAQQCVLAADALIAELAREEK